MSTGTRDGHTETLSGRYFNLRDPRPHEIELEDISVALSHICRFGGHVRHRYTVAQHSVLVCRLVRREGHFRLALPALHHDSHEAYVGDLTTPVKDELKSDEYRRITEGIDYAIGRHFGFDPDDMRHPLIKAADQEAMRMEAYVLKVSRGVGPHWGYSMPLPPPTSLPLPEITDAKACAEFERLHRLETM